MRLPKGLHSMVKVYRNDGTVQIMPHAEVGWREETLMRRFQLDRREDVSGVSGTGIVAEGVVFADGTTVMRWTCEYASTAIYANINELYSIHGHDGSTVLRWIDG